MAEVKTSQDRSPNAAPLQKSAAALKPAPHIEVEYGSYAIRKGETLSSIAKARQCTVSDLISLNKGIEPTKLRVGQQITVPNLGLSSKPEEIKKQDFVWYQVRDGDSFARLARDNPAVIQGIKDLNPGIDQKGLQVGQSIRLPNVDIFQAVQKKALPTKQAAQQEALTALKVLEDAKAEAEGRGKSWVMSAESRPNPQAYLALHKLLKLSGIHDAPDAAQYTDDTRKAIERFQETHAIPVDGKVGPKLLAVLQRDFATVDKQMPAEVHAKAIKHAVESRTELLDKVANGSVKLSYGKDPSALSVEERGMVRQLQLLLQEAGVTMTTKSNGVYDDATKEAVKHFQGKIMKLPPEQVDGIAGAKTITSLLKNQRDFLESLEYVLTKEGLKSDNPNDPGGLTYKGVTQRNYDTWRTRNNLDPRPVTEIGMDELRAFYRRGYWNKANCNILPTGVNCAAFDYAVNSGVGRPNKVLNKIAEERGIPITEMADTSRAEHKEIVSDITTERKEFINNLITARPSMREFKRGLIDRVGTTEKKAHSMIAKSDKS